ncbi:hypothetical protein GCM10007962_28290 [Yeosuana aromativorans]|uniref:Uncharacterized protein n=1 Tax=Yeosuana aromativorans TaxID=288019 RepID=A0A8J3BMM5_9FLAO|nr:hypothetical protein GCM10007962_28290 [Yeosuana aromativorans]
METPMMDGNKKKIKVAIPLNNPLIPIGELTTLEEPVVTVKKSKIPAELADKNNDSNKKIAM